MYTVELYRIDVTGEAFARVAVLENYKGLSFSRVNNDIGLCTFSLSLFDQFAKRENLIPFRTQILIKKNDAFEWAGFISNVSFSYEPDSGSVSIEGTEYLGHLSSRYTDTLKYYSSVDAGAIAWDLINTVQNRTNGWIGINQGTIEATVDRDRTYENKRVLDAIIDLTNVQNGFDITTTILSDGDNHFTGINFNVFENVSVVRDTIPPFAIGENINSVDLILANRIVNTVTVLGAGTGEDAISSASSDSTSQISFTRREGINSRSDISELNTLTETATALVNDLKAEAYKVQLGAIPGTAPVLGAINLGDVVYVDLRVDNSYLDFNRTAILDAIKIAIDDNGVEYITYTVRT